MGINRANCTCTVMGVISFHKDKGLDMPTIIKVEYQVNGITYTIKDTVKLKCSAIKIGFLPIGMNKEPVMGDTRVGSPAMVSYNPNNPAEAFITHNTGFINC